MSGRGAPPWNPFAAGSIITMYGLPPPEETGRTPFPDILPVPLPPLPPLTPTILPQPYIQTPDTAEGLIERMKHRVTWLENELRMHEAWKSELETLKKMLEAIT